MYTVAALRVCCGRELQANRCSAMIDYRRLGSLGTRLRPLSQVSGRCPTRSLGFDLVAVSSSALSKIWSFRRPRKGDISTCFDHMLGSRRSQFMLALDTYEKVQKTLKTPNHTRHCCAFCCANLKTLRLSIFSLEAMFTGLSRFSLQQDFASRNSATYTRNWIKPKTLPFREAPHWAPLFFAALLVSALHKSWVIRGLSKYVFSLKNMSLITAINHIMVVNARLLCTLGIRTEQPHSLSRNAIGPRTELCGSSKTSLALELPLTIEQKTSPPTTSRSRPSQARLPSSCSRLKTRRDHSKKLTMLRLRRT